MAEERERDLVETLGAFFDAANALQRATAADIEAGSGMPHRWFEVLVRLKRASGRSRRITELAAAMTLPQSSMTRLVDELEHAGLIERLSDPADRRVTSVHLTAKGLRRIGRLLDIYLSSAQRHLVDVLTPEQLDRLEEISRAIRDAN